VLRELAHVLRSATSTLALKARLPQADFYDEIMQRADAAGVGAHRRELARGLAGEVLEIGCGTGLMFPHYEEGAHVTAIDLDAASIAIARRRAVESAARVVVREASAMELPFSPASFDACVVALVLCSVPDVARALAELSRVMRPRGELRLIEHVRSDRPVGGALMAALDPLWVLLNGQGCHMHRRVEPELVRAGFVIEDVVPFQVFAPGIPPFPMRRIRALAR
jgi:SAM-dependent methyltransferase